MANIEKFQSYLSEYENLNPAIQSKINSIPEDYKTSNNPNFRKLKNIPEQERPQILTALVSELSTVLNIKTPDIPQTLNYQKNIVDYHIDFSAEEILLAHRNSCSGQYEGLTVFPHFDGRQLGSIMKAYRAKINQSNLIAKKRLAEINRMMQQRDEETIEYKRASNRKAVEGEYKLFLEGKLDPKSRMRHVHLLPFIVYQEIEFSEEFERKMMQSRIEYLTKKEEAERFAEDFDRKYPPGKNSRRERMLGHTVRLEDMLPVAKGEPGYELYIKQRDKIVEEEKMRVAEIKNKEKTELIHLTKEDILEDKYCNYYKIKAIFERAKGQGIKDVIKEKIKNKVF